MSHRFRSVLVASALLLAGRSGAPQPSHRPDAGVGGSQRPLLVSYTCAASAAPFGGPDVSVGLTVDLATSSWLYTHTETRRDREPIRQSEGPRAIPAAAVARIRSLVTRMLAGTRWPTQPAVSEGMACSVSIREPAATGSRVTVQRQTTRRGDVPDQLIRAIVALRAHGIQP